MRQPLTCSFEKKALKIIEDACEAFPDKLARLAVMVFPSAETPIYISPQVTGELTKNTATIREAVKKVRGHMSRLGATGLASRDYDLAGTKVDFVAVMDNKIATSSYSQLYLQDMQAIFTLNHEIGHLVVRNGIANSEHLSECAANAFAMLRHIQIFGQDTGFEAARSAKMISRLVLSGDPVPYTIDTLHRAIEVAGEIGHEAFAALPLPEIAKLAAKIAGDTRFRPQQLEKLRAAFRPVAEYNHIYKTRKLAAYDTAPNAMIYKAVAAAQERHSDNPDVFTAVQRFFGTVVPSQSAQQPRNTTPPKFNN